jgi:acyl-CoA hydrolase/RimJ/RimL family protein N-acetyltransferase
MATGQQPGETTDAGAAIKAAAAIAPAIRSGARIFIGTGCGEPRTLVRALDVLRPAPKDLELVSIFPTGRFDPSATGPRRHRNRAFIAGHPAGAGGAPIDYVPIGLDEVPWLLAQGRLPVDVAMVQASPPDAHGYLSLGISVDLAPAALLAAKRVIALVNPAMPRSHGDSLIHRDRIDTLIEAEEPLGEYHEPTGSEPAVHIAAYIANIIEDGSCLHIGLGDAPNRVLRLLGDRRDLGIHTDLLTDGVIELIRCNAVTGRQKGWLRERIVASYCLGTRRLYDLIDDNPLFHFLPIEQVCAPDNLARLARLVSITQAHAIDLGGQVSVDHLTGAAEGGLATQAAFLKAAARSAGGKPIICLPSTWPDGTSRICPALAQAQAVGIPRADVHYVVTEYGIAYLFGRSATDRALALIGVAHPDHRADLLAAAKRLGFVAPSQTWAPAGDYAVQAERMLRLKNGKDVRLRPARPTDAAALRGLFHQLSADDVYMRFFQRMNTLPDATLQSLCNVNDESDVAYVATTGPRENEVVVGSGCYFLNPANGLAEVAYMVVPDWQGAGLGSALQQRLREHAQGHGVKGFVAEVLPGNARMLRLAEAVGGRQELVRDEDGVKVTHWF